MAPGGTRQGAEGIAAHGHSCARDGSRRYAGAGHGVHGRLPSRSERRARGRRARRQDSRPGANLSGRHEALQPVRQEVRLDVEHSEPLCRCRPGRRRCGCRAPVHRIWLSHCLLPRAGSAQRAGLLAAVAPHAQLGLGPGRSGSLRARRFPTWRPSGRAPARGAGAGGSRDVARAEGSTPPGGAPGAHLPAGWGHDARLPGSGRCSRPAPGWSRCPGVGPKTSAAVLLFSRLRKPALPVDSHHYRVAVRLGLLSARVPVGRSHAVLAALFRKGGTRSRCMITTRC